MKFKLIVILVIGIIAMSSFTISAGEFTIDELQIEEIFKIKQNSTSPKLSTLSVSGNLAGLIWQIDESMVSNYIQTLEDFGPRLTGTTACEDAGNYIFNVFNSMGLEVRRQYWTSGSYSSFNIEATIYGETNPDEIYIICGHYDSVAGCPGADDNAAGTAAVLAAADVMSNFNWDYTIRFVAFSGEEQWMLGSLEYVEEASNNGDDIKAALNVDMIGYALTEDHRSKVKVFTDSTSHWLVPYTSSVEDTYTDLIDLTIIDGGYDYSDNWAFWQYGYSANFYHEFKFNDYYHTSEDTSDKLDMDYDMRITRLAMATLGELAGLSDGSGDDDDDDDDDDYIYIPPYVKIDNPFDRTTVNNSLMITGKAYDFHTYIKYVFLKIGDSSWFEADLNNVGNGMAEWSFPWDTTTVDDGEIILSAVSINREGIQSPVDYTTVTVQNEEDPEPVKNPDLESTGSIQWSDIKPKLVIQGEFTIENVGDSESELDWEISDTPDWGDWTFNPSEGYNLTPEDGSFSIELQLVTPDEKNQNFTGEIKVVNKADVSDYNIIPVSLTTSKNKGFEIYPRLLQFLENHQNLFSLLRQILGL